MSLRPLMRRAFGRDGDDSGGEPQVTDSLDDVLDVIRNGRRREAIRKIAGVDEVDLGEIAREIAASENDTVPAQVTSTQRKAVYVVLYQSHVPKLVEHGIVEYDGAAGTLYPTEKAESWAELLHEVQQRTGGGL